LDPAAAKILLVDDDDLSRRMMSLLLSEKGYNYDTATNGIEAIEAIKSQSYDIVLMDLQMPLMDGFEATSNIRAWEAGNQHTPIVALTAMLFGDEIQKCLSVGMDDCISKPFNTEALFQLIETYVNKSGRQPLKVELQTKTDAREQVLLDVRDALPRFSDDVEFYRDFLNEFIEELPQRLNQFRANFLSKDFKTLADKAHSLKGISASMGAKQLASLSQKLDQNSQDGDPVVIQQTLEEIEQHVLLLREKGIDILSGFKGQ
jgi:two-component system, sensor histidine kinase and response regulator